MIFRAVQGTHTGVMPETVISLHVQQNPAQKNMQPFWAQRLLPCEFQSGYFLSDLACSVFLFSQNTHTALFSSTNLSRILQIPFLSRCKHVLHSFIVFEESMADWCANFKKVDDARLKWRKTLDKSRSGRRFLDLECWYFPGGRLIRSPEAEGSIRRINNILDTRRDPVKSSGFVEERTWLKGLA